jgi:translation initiation factor IF-2
MTEIKATRLSKIARELNVGITTIVEYLHKKGHHIESDPNTKITPEQYNLLAQEYSSDLNEKKKSENFSLKNLREKKESISLEDIQDSSEPEEEEASLLIKDSSAQSAPKHEKKSDEKHSEKEIEPPIEKVIDIKVVGKVDLDALKVKKPKVEEPKPVEEPKSPEKSIEKEVKAEVEVKVEDFVEKDKKAKPGVTVVGKIDLEAPRKKSKAKEKSERTEKVLPAEPVVSSVNETPSVEDIEPLKTEELVPEVEEVDIILPEADDNMIPTRFEKLTGPTVIGRIDLPVRELKKKPVASSSQNPQSDKKKKRKRIHKDGEGAENKERHVSGGSSSAPATGGAAGQSTQRAGKKKKKLHRSEVSEEDVQKQIKDTLAKLTTKGKSKGSRHRRDKRDAFQQRLVAEHERAEEDKNTLKVTEFVSASELASLMNVSVSDVIQTCMSLGLFVSINQRLDAETLSIVADEFNYKVEFISVDLQDNISAEEDKPEDLLSRPPIVTVMGHVDHGKTKLLDYIRNANVIAGEAGGITQHIGAYSVILEGDRKITFLDTPGHEAFTAMRARGAQVTDIAIIVVAADDGIMPQTKEAINHASAAGVPIVFAINKIDKPTANPEKIKESLAQMNYLVEDWGGKYQSQEISAKTGLHIEDLLEKVLLEAELLDLKANPNRHALGTVIESALDKGRGYVATILIENGTLNIGDVLLAGSHYGHIKAMYNERGGKVTSAGPATPVLILGLNGAPQAGDRFNVMDSDREAKEIATRREQLQREQDLRTMKHITLDEIGRRIAIGNFKELNVIIKGDVDGSVEALSDSLLKLSTEEIQVNIIHKAVGQISESDVLLAAASNAVIIGFQVRPSLGARKLAEKEQIDIRMYSIIYDAIEELRAAMEGMLSPEIREEITATLEIKEVFKITKTGTIAGCIVKEGKISRTSKVRVIRDGIVVFTGELGSLKRFKDDAKEVVSGLECGLNINNFNDIKAGDYIEAFTETEIKKKL